MKNWRLISALAAGLTGCSTAGAAEAYLEEQGLEDVEVEREGANEFSFTGERDGLPCEGTLALAGLLVLGSEQKMEVRCAGEPETDGAVASEDPVGLGEPVTASLRRLDSGFSVEAQTDNASLAARALLEALAAGERGWIADRAAPSFRRELAGTNTGIGAGLRHIKRVKLGPPQVISSTDKREVVSFKVESLERFVTASMEFMVTFHEKRYEGFELTGDGWDMASQGTPLAPRRFSSGGGWVYTEEDGILPGAVFTGPGTVKARFVFDDYQVIDGYGLLEDSYTIWRDGQQLEYVKPERARRTGNGIKTNVVLTDPSPGHYRIELRVADIRAGGYVATTRALHFEVR